MSRPKSTDSNVLPSLPPEVWICIFHHATHVLGTLVPDIYAHAGLVGPVYNSIFHPRLREALITKRALVCVCKQWWYLAIPCLYQSVYIRRVRSLTSLSKTLADSAASKGTLVTTRLLGEYTQRLDIAIRDHCVDEHAESGLLAVIISCMPSLAIVSFATRISYIATTGFSANITHALRYTAPSLRVLDWSSGLLSSPHLMSLLAKCTRLRVLNCLQLVWSKDFDHGGIPPTVTTLRMQIIPRHYDLDYHVLEQARRPGPTALQELILSLDRLSWWTDLLRVYSSQLISVQYYIPSSPVQDVEGHMELLAQTCPSLCRLTITSNRFSTFIRPNLVFPSITYLGLRATRFQLTRKEFKTLFTFLEELRSSVPSLQVVRLLNERTLCCLFNTHTKLAVRALQPFTEAAPFRVEDEEGVLLTGSKYLVLTAIVLELTGFCASRQAKGPWTSVMIVHMLEEARFYLLDWDYGTERHIQNVCDSNITMML